MEFDKAWALAIRAARAGQMEEAAAHFRAATEAAPGRSDAWNNLGSALQALGRATEAEPAFRRAIHLDPAHGIYPVNLGMCLLALNQFDAAEAVAREVLRSSTGAADAWGVLGAALLALKRFEEAESALARASAIDPKNSDFLAQRGLALFKLDRLTESEAVLRSSLGNPRSQFNLGLVLRKLERFEEAAESFQRTTARIPEWPEPWDKLGSVLQRLHRFDAAADAFRRAVALDPSHALFHLHLGRCLFRMGRLEAAATALMAAPRHPEVLVDLATVLRHHDKHALAMDALDEALASMPQHGRARTLRAMLLLELGQMEEGWREYEARLTLALPRGSALPAEPPQWDGTTPGIRLLLRSEQGFGDVFQMLRFLPGLVGSGHRICLEVPSSLVSLVQGQPWDLEVVSLGEEVGPVDAVLPIMSLPHVLRLQPGQLPGPIPYLRADEGKGLAWEQWLGPRQGLRVGLVWAGSPGYDSDSDRSIPFSDFSQLLSTADVQWISLQHGASATADLAGQLGDRLLHAGARFQDFSDTAALLATLDLLVSVDTSVAHLAGAMGLETWLLLPRPSDWRWQREGERSPWYPGHRLYRQPSRGDWGTVLSRVGTALKERI